jgi:hypothetical protein
MTGLVFGDAIRINRPMWGQPRFWLLLGTVLVVQCVVGTMILLTVTKVPTVLWVFLIPLDYVAVGACLAVVLRRQ